MEGPVTERSTVREVVRRYPGADRIFEKHGLGGCGGDDGPTEPVGFFASLHPVEPVELIAELNENASSQAVPISQQTTAAPASAPPT